jgi:hypothetical protein
MKKLKTVILSGVCVHNGMDVSRYVLLATKETALMLEYLGRFFKEGSMMIVSL